MNTKTMKQFNVLNTDSLATVEGGKIDWGRTFGCVGSVTIGAMDGYMMTSGATIFLGPYAIGTGAVGAVIGGVGGALTC
ncbi:TPA: bacteriocin class II family protein [Streptococcus suis]